MTRSRRPGGGYDWRSSPSGNSRLKNRFRKARGLQVNFSGILLFSGYGASQAHGLVVTRFSERSTHANKNLGVSMRGISFRLERGVHCRTAIGFGRRWGRRVDRSEEIVESLVNAAAPPWRLYCLHKIAFINAASSS
jgi:hypothetical protein